MNVSLAPKPTKISILISHLPVNIPKSSILNSIFSLTDPGLSGIFFRVPTIAGSIFNAAITGLVYEIVPAETATAFIEVHSIHEEIAFMIATAAGIKLGVKTIGSPENVSEALMETLEVVMATSLLVGVAAFLEAFFNLVLRTQYLKSVGY